MIRKQPNDYLEVIFEEKYFYIVVLSKVVMFGGSLIFPFHTDGSRQNVEELLHHPRPKGFNCCTDLTLAKRRGRVRRIDKLEHVEKFWKSKLLKQPHALQLGDPVPYWHIYSIENFGEPIKTVKWMRKKFRNAIDRTTTSFDVTAEYILEGYSPDQNPFLKKATNKKRNEMYGTEVPPTR